MKELYVRAEIEVVVFECASVITTSGNETPIVPFNEDEGI